MDQLRVRALKNRYPSDYAQLRALGESDVGPILAVLDLDATLGFAAEEFVKTMSGEEPAEIYHLLFHAVESFKKRAEEMFPGLDREQKDELNQSIRSLTCPTNNNSNPKA